LLSDVGFGCTESYPLPYVNFEFAPWFCGELLRAVGDGFLAGALVFLLTAASRKTRIKPRA
ncbi:MAG: hypothetical protein V1817_02565, partial [Candidatus Micrarchaeota archaeon]